MLISPFGGPRGGLKSFRQPVIVKCFLFADKKMIKLCPHHLETVWRHTNPAIKSGILSFPAWVAPRPSPPTWACDASQAVSLTSTSSKIAPYTLQMKRCSSPLTSNTSTLMFWWTTSGVHAPSCHTLAQTGDCYWYTSCMWSFYWFSLTDDVMALTEEYLAKNNWNISIERKCEHVIKQHVIKQQIIVLSVDRHSSYSISTCR